MSIKPLKSLYVIMGEECMVVWLRCVKCGEIGVDLAVVTGRARGVCVDCVREREQVANYWGGAGGKVR